MADTDGGTCGHSRTGAQWIERRAGQHAGQQVCIWRALTRYNLCKTPSKASRIYIVNWDLREPMTESDIEIILERAKELHPGARPRIIFDNGPQFIAKDFKEFIRISGMTHVRNSPYYPQPPSVSLEVM